MGREEEKNSISQAGLKAFNIPCLIVLMSELSSLDGRVCVAAEKRLTDDGSECAAATGTSSPGSRSLDFLVSLFFSDVLKRNQDEVPILR